MFGYATNETEEYMPYPISLAHKLAKQLTKVRKDGTLTYLRPDGKSQVSVEYDENDKPVRLEAVVLSTQHDPDVTQEQIHEDIKKYVFDPILPQELIDDNTKFFINPTGRFVIGGPHGDAGLTGRKIIVDTYGGYARHGGGAFSGKDCTKVDRSAAYAARYVAKKMCIRDSGTVEDIMDTPESITGQYLSGAIKIPVPEKRRKPAGWLKVDVYKRQEQGITCIYPEEKDWWYVKVPAFSFSKLKGMDAYLSPEMKSTGEAIGYDRKLHRACLLYTSKLFPYCWTVWNGWNTEVMTQPVLRLCQQMGICR